MKARQDTFQIAEETAPRGPRGAVTTRKPIGWSELDRNTRVEGAFGTGIVAHAIDDTKRTGGMVIAGLVLHVTVGHPHVNKVGKLWSPNCLAGIKRKADRLPVEIDDGIGSRSERRRLGSSLAQ